MRKFLKKYFFKCLEIALPILSKDDLEFNKKCLTDLEQFAFQVLLFAREPTDIFRKGLADSSESDSRNFPSKPNELKGFRKIRKCPSAEAFVRKTNNKVKPFEIS
jgi:hypothetical protein